MKKSRLLGFIFPPKLDPKKEILTWKEEMFLKARPLNREQTYMRVNLCIILYYYVIFYILFTFDSEFRHILTQLCKRPTMRFNQYEKAFLLKYDIIMSQQRSYTSL